MRVLLDTNILIHREASSVVNHDIGILFNWFDRLRCTKLIHPKSITEIEKHGDPKVVETFGAKLKSYDVLKTIADDAPEISQIRIEDDRDENDAVDTSILNELFVGRVDALISEDKRVHQKAYKLGLVQRVFSIDAFLEKVTAENPELRDYNVLSVKKEFFGNIDLSDSFFDSFRRDYDGFDAWFHGKADDTAYICHSDTNELLAFLYVKIEGPEENYSDIDPVFERKRRLKIGTFKVILNGHKLGERFVKIIFDNALQYDVDEIYVTIFDIDEDHQRLVNLLSDFGFKHHGKKVSISGEEEVYVRDFSRRVMLDTPAQTLPFISANSRKFIVPIYPEYHTELFPDSILRTESPDDYVENKPNRNALRKVYISRSFERNLTSGDIIVFYRTASGGPAHYTSVATTIGVVESVVTNLPGEQEFIDLCRKRSVFSDDELREHWRYNPRNRPFIVNFLYVHSFPHRLNLRELKEFQIIEDAPRGFEPLSDQAFEQLIKRSNADQRHIVYQA